MNVQNKNSNIKNSEIWDKKAKSYSKFDGNLNEFQIRFFKILKDFDVSFKDKTLVDIGCGTGIYSLYLAGICKMVLGVDSSTKMLEELNLKKAEFKINNLQTINSDFKNFQTADKFDIAFLTMSPALQNEDDFNKFMDLGNLRIYLNWEEPKNSSMLDPFYKIYKRNDKNKNTASNLQNFLIKNNISYKTEVLREIRSANRSFNEAFENTIWHLEINGIKYDEGEIKNTLLKMQKDGFIEDVIKSKMRVLVF
ncbi:class I SAM-dependent methyltransferase [Campylobacter ureolyticus]|uniref:SAM-dependent methyltransferase n=1 Tax=Campylobacter ureolyticus TaxID=827 RepID=A0AAE7E8H7_9BACT|nr:class I SAM-dependent methyltransferase [Campylobacter ureolyticus]MCR8684702.1 class I SAM-dependent methyltransferase [Campylobacter ureolyticus]QKF83586.1 SAM-dependent methyltransferase [Campylobacter ureolyticus]QQY36258.1 class I SAM-dependent methyltransferase [Campylobacter ureolyticus]SUX25221.1 methyltransferase domain-containing protein [Campylobacter ureolyticus]